MSLRTAWEGTMSKQTDMADKIAKLLAKAEGASTEAEATAFFEAAERLMLKWGIDELMVQQRKGGDPADVIESRRYQWLGSSLSTTWINDCLLMSAIANHHGLRMLMAKQARTFVLVGYGTDYERAIASFLSLVVQMNRFAAQAWKDVPAETRRNMGQYDKRVWQRSFREGFVDRITLRLRELRREVQDEALAEHGDGMALVLRSRKAQVDEFYDGLSKGTSRARASRTNYNARAAGRDSATRADMGHQRVRSGGRTAIG